MIEKNSKKASDSVDARPRTLKQMAVEVFSIVLGVLLALAVSEWQESRNNREKAAVALANIRAELQNNLDLLEIIHPGNAEVVESISSEQSENPEDAKVIPGVQMRSSAWQTLATTGLSNFVEYDLLIKLSQLYAMIDVYKNTAYGFINASMSLAATATALDRPVDNDRYSENFLVYFQMIVQVEDALITAHEDAINAIDHAAEQ